MVVPKTESLSCFGLMNSTTKEPCHRVPGLGFRVQGLGVLGFVTVTCHAFHTYFLNIRIDKATKVALSESGD